MKPSKKLISVCAGIGGFDLGFERAGFETAIQVEIDNVCNSVLARHFPKANRSINDISKVRRAAIRKIIREKLFALLGGTPCQGFSFAGLRGSLEDERSNLCLQFCKIADELDPTLIVWENVFGVLSTPDNAFGNFLAAIVGASSPLIPPSGAGGGWTNAGLVIGPRRAAAWRVFDSQFLGVAQRRRRVFVVASPFAGYAEEILFEREGLRRHSPPCRQAGAGVASSLTCGLGSGGADDNKAQANHIVAHTLRGEGFDASEDGTGRGTPLVIATDGCDRVANAVTSKWAKGTGGPAGDECQNLVAVTLTGKAAADHASQEANLICSEVSPTIPAGENNTGGNRPFGTSAETAESLIAFNHRQDPVASEVGLPIDRSGGGAIAGVRVRRLTPTECERLQGFPDEWTAWGTTDADHSIQLAISDSKRYKQLGNAVTVNVIEWIAKRAMKFAP